MENKKYLIKVNNCPHCREDLNYSSESSDIQKTMYCIFKLIDIHRDKCFKIKGRKFTRVNIREQEVKSGLIISEYKTNKILF